MAALNPQTAAGWLIRITKVKRESMIMAKTLFRFVKQVASLAQKLTYAALIEISNPAGNGFAGWKHAVLLYQKFHMDATYEEIIDWAEEMDRIRLLLVPGAWGVSASNHPLQSVQTDVNDCLAAVAPPLGCAPAKERPWSH